MILIANEKQNSDQLLPAYRSLIVASHARMDLLALWQLIESSLSPVHNARPYWPPTDRLPD